MATMRRAVFLDRDGVLNVDHGYVFKIGDLELMPNVGRGLQRLQAHGYLLIVITNQSGVARGMYSLDDVHSFNQELAATLKRQFGVVIDQFYVCPHHPDATVPELRGPCGCRKPATGLVDAAVASWGIDRSQSFMIGDKQSDIEMAANAQLVGIQVTSSRYGRSELPCLFAADLVEAATVILGPQT